MTKNNTGRDIKLREAALKAIKATNYCTMHNQYHGQKYENCTPQERILIEVKGDSKKEKV